MVDKVAKRTELDKLIKNAPVWQPDEKPREGDKCKGKDHSKKDLTQTYPEVAAKQVITAQFTVDDIVTLRHWREAPRIWTGCAWQEMSKGDFEARINAELNQRYQNITKRRFGDVQHNVTAITNVSDTLEPPAIIEGSGYSTSINIAAKEWDLRKAIFGVDGVLYPPWLLSKTEKCFVPASPHFFASSAESVVHFGFGEVAEVVV